MSNNEKKQPSKKDWLDYIKKLKAWIKETFPDVSALDDEGSNPNPPPKPPKPPK